MMIKNKQQMILYSFKIYYLIIKRLLKRLKSAWKQTADVWSSMNFIYKCEFQFVFDTT